MDISASRNRYACLYDGEPDYRFDCIINETSLGVEYYFNKTIFDKLHYFGDGGL